MQATCSVCDDGEHIVEQMPGSPDEGDALDILILPRPLADEQQLCFRIAVAEDDMLPCLAEGAAVAGQALGLQGVPV